MFICDNWFHAVFIRQSSKRERVLKLIYIYLLLLYNSSITDIEYSPDYTAFGLL